jgi:K+ transporter
LSCLSIYSQKANSIWVLKLIEEENPLKQQIIRALVDKIKNEIIAELNVSSGRDEEGNFMVAVTSKVQDYLILKLAETRYNLGIEKKQALDEW